MSRTSQSEQAETRCSSCGKTDMETTLIPIRLKGKDQWICAKCLPRLIHGPNRLIVEQPSGSNRKGYMAG